MPETTPPTSLASPPADVPWYASRRVVWGGAAGLLLLHFALSNAGTWNKCGTFDEDSHIGNAYSSVETDDYRMAPLAMLQYRWMTIPLRIARINVPPTDQPYWGESDNWGYARRLMYDVGNDPWFILHSTRIMTSLWSVVVGLIVFVWSQHLFGTAGGFISLLMYVFNPTALAHGAAATTDMCATWAFTAATASLWYVLHRLTPLSLLTSSLVWGMAFCSKFSLLLMIPVGVLMVIVRLVSGVPLEVSGGPLFARRGEVRMRLLRLPIFLGIGLVHVLVTWCVIWVLYNFQFNMFNEFPNDPKRIYTGSFEQVQEQAGGLAPLIGYTRQHRLLPEGYLYWFAETVKTTSVRSSYLNGRYGIYGFPSYFLYCLWYKTPISCFVLFGLAVAAVVPRLRYRSVTLGNHPLWAVWQGFYCTAPLWCLIAVYWQTSITRGINIGIRHILPTFPAMFILTGAAGLWLMRRPASPAVLPTAVVPEPATVANSNAAAPSAEAVPAEPPRPVSPLDPISPQMQTGLRYAVYGCLAALVIDVGTAFPNYLAYFNLFGGGTAGGYHHLVDSSLDWGQELPNLGRWLDENIRSSSNPPKVYISYFGSVPPKAFGVDGTWLPSYFSIETLEPGRRPKTVFRLTEGVYCISATSLACVYNSYFPGPWRFDYEQSFHRLNNLIQTYMQNLKNPEVLKSELQKSGIRHWDEAIRLFDAIRFARLCAHLRYRPPDAMINGAILIFKLSDADLKQIMETPPREMYPPPAKSDTNVPF